MLCVRHEVNFLHWDDNHELLNQFVAVYVVRHI